MNKVELYAPRTMRHRRTWTAAAIVLMVVFFIAGQLATIFGVLKPMGFHQADLNTQWAPLTIQLLGFGVTALLILAWVGLFERRSPAALGLNGQALVRYGRGLLTGAGFLIASIGLAWALGGYHIEGIGVWSAPSPILFLPILCLFAGFMVQGATEELMLRGWLLQLVASRHGLVAAIIVNAVVFAVLHAGNIKPSLELALALGNLLLFSVLISLYAIKEGSLWGVCAWHTAWNTLLGVGFGLDVSGAKVAVQSLVVDLAPNANAAWWLTGGAFGPEASVATSAVLLAGVVYLLANGALRQGARYSTPGLG
ncbi:CPBP family intramembrane metalloprotease domain-containing protein [Caulobacter sp. B11]|uniref:CPBP family intramembrane glutamic endopeptidase n=1 Tax=Caulobacter sp. B11 TaxID=2048899 RepID=UPI000C12AF90|nr:type II CAAX endopeptidase family protein [Caulobacter sp. B11]PHY13940.1 CPBP family intramembrane metalloprotease domain-containing protein [Caulobacter sp. B11]